MPFKKEPAFGAWRTTQPLARRAQPPSSTSLTAGNCTVAPGDPGTIENHSTPSPSKSAATVQVANAVSSGQSISPGVPAVTIIVRVPSMTIAKSLLARPSTIWKPGGGCTAYAHATRSIVRSAATWPASPRSSAAGESRVRANAATASARPPSASMVIQNRRVRNCRTAKA